jgi:hypothetical protein
MQHRGFFGWGSLALVAILLWSMAALAQQPASIGGVAALQGQATAQRQGSAQPVPLRLHSPVYPEDVVQTAAASRLKLALVGGTELTLGEQGTLTLSRFVYAPQQKSQHILLRIAKGAFRVVTQTLLPQATFEVHTTTAVAAVRGTDWLGEVTSETTAFFVQRGKVTVTHADATIRGEVVLTEGMGTDVQGKQPPTPPKKWAAARVQALQRATALP